MMKGLPVRTRLTLVYGGLLFLAMTLLGIGCMTLLRYRLTVRMDVALDQRLQGVENFLVRETTPGQENRFPGELAEYASTQPEGHYIEVTDDARKVLLKSDVVMQPARSREKTFTIYGKVYHTRASASAEPISDSVQEIGLLFLGLSPILLILIGLTGYWISSRSLRPVDEMTKAARSIGSNNLSERLPVPRTRDEISRLAEAWNEMLGRLEESFSRIQRFTADAAHELRTPLAALRTTAELALKHDRNPHEYQEALTQVGTITDRMNQLAEGLLSIARSDDTHKRQSAELIDVPTIVAEVAAEMHLLFEDKDIVLTMEVPEAKISIKGDPDGIRRILAVLLDNALKYSSHGDSVKVSVHQGIEDVSVEVADTGCGIPGEALPRIFDRFYRVDSSRDRKTGGYGLGLAIAQQIARAHQGLIVATSVVGEGSIFRFTLPLALPAEPARS